MRISTELLTRVFGQMDSQEEAIRLVAFAKAHKMLHDNGLSFSNIINGAMIYAKADEQNTAQPTGATAPANIAESTPEKPYLHDRVAGRFSRRHNGKRVIRNTTPPIGSIGRLRVLSDVDSGIGYGFRELRLSFETHDAIYEPFKVERSDAEVLHTLRDCSVNGTPLRFF